MTDHKPFTAEQLDEFGQRTQSPDYAIVGATYEEWNRLIAQAREEIRLREEREERQNPELWKRIRAKLARALPAVSSANLSDAADAAMSAVFGNSPIATEGPAARAKRELGELLIREHVRVHRNGPSWVDEERFTCELQLDVDRFVRHGATENEAIAAALRAAKGSGR